jgi:hypothetical protein
LCIRAPKNANERIAFLRNAFTLPGAGSGFIDGYALHDYTIMSDEWFLAAGFLQKTEIWSLRPGSE